MASKKAMKVYDTLAKYADAQEAKYLDRISQAYSDALRESVKKYKSIFKKCQDVWDGKVQPPDFYVRQGDEAVQRWKVGFITQTLRTGSLAQGIAKEMESAMKLVPGALDETLADIYDINRDETVKLLQYEGNQLGINISFRQINKDEIPIILDEERGAMTKIAYNRFTESKGLQDRLQNEMFKAVMTGEGVSDLTKRVQEQIAGQYDPNVLATSQDPLLRGCKNVAEYELRCARRIAQTEMTRVQSQARNDAMQEAADMGINMAKEWSCRMFHSRDTHIALHGQTVMEGETFKLIDGDELEYPGDPNGRACNVINCYCVLIPRVLKRNERLTDDEQDTPHQRSVEVNGNPQVDLEYINSDEYKNKFSNITEDKEINDIIYRRCKAALTHQNGKYTQDLSVIDVKSAKLKYKSSSKVDYETLYNDDIKKKILEQKRYSLFSVHNHGTNLPPSGADLTSAGYYGYKFGVVACHNGQVFVYSIQHARPFTRYKYDDTVAKYKDMGYNVYDATIKTLQAMREYGVEWRKL